MLEDPTAVVYVNARVRTGDPAHPTARALRLAADRITHVYDGAPPVGTIGRVVDLGGATVLPGLVDAHVHLRGIGQTAAELDLRGTRSVDEIVARVREAASSVPVGTWIRGRGWDQNDWPVQAFPTRAALDAAAPEHPVWLTRVDGHSVWVSSRALTLAGVTGATQSPEGGEILHDSRGDPTGVLVDNAISLVERQLPEASDEELRADLVRGIALVTRAGLTGVHDMAVPARTLAALRAMDQHGELGLRVTVYVDGADPALAEVLRVPPEREGLLRVVGVKLFADGALGSRGAALLAPYSDRPESSGLLVMEPEALRERATAVHAAGYQLAIHAIGDRGNRVALDAIEAAEGADRSRRHRIEHAQLVAAGDFARFASLGVVASMQPTHATSDMPWAEARVGGERIRGAYAWRSMLRAGVLLPLGSDAPVEGENPWWGIHAAVTRQDAEGSPPGGWRPEERLGLDEAVEGFTRAPARVAGDDDLGVIRPGARADLTIVREDPWALPPRALRDVHTLRTVVSGREVWVAP